MWELVLHSLAQDAKMPLLIRADAPDLVIAPKQGRVWHVGLSRWLGGRDHDIPPCLSLPTVKSSKDGGMTETIKPAL